MTVEIDQESGFCFGVVTAITKAEQQLDASGETLYCLGDIVHNAREVERLERRGLITITHERLAELHGAKVLLRAHGEPPSTYELARRNGIEIIDATCPVVLRLQQRIRSAYEKGVMARAQGLSAPLIVIYGKRGHAEVNGLVGQTDGEAVVVQDLSELDSVDLSGDVLLFSQTTKSVPGFMQVVEAIRLRKEWDGGKFEYFDTICRQVANRIDHLRRFAASHEVIVFVSGAKSSNGKVLCEVCRSENPRTHLVGDESEIDPRWFDGAESVGICGATSTPRWLMANVAERISGLDSIS